MELKIDPDFESKIPPLTADVPTVGGKYRYRRRSDYAAYCLEWRYCRRHNRYKVICAHPEAQFSIHDMVFADRYAALIRICRNQLGRCNLTPQQKKYVIGQRYEVEKLSEQFRGNQYTSIDRSCCGQNDHSQNHAKTRERIAEETKTSDSYVHRAEYYANGVDAADEVIPGIKQELLSWSIKPTDSEVAATARASPEERPCLARRLRMTKKEKQEELERQQAEAEYQQNTEPPFPYENARADEDIKTPPCEDNEMNIPNTKPLDKPKFRTKDILQISEGLLHPKTVTEDSILSCLDDTINTMINSCNHYFTEYPRLLTEPEYKMQVLQILQKCENFVQDIEKGKMHET